MISDSALAREFWARGKSPRCPVIDMHGHMGAHVGSWMPRATPEAMLRTMDGCGVRMLVFCHHYALMAPDIGNRPNIEVVRRYPDRFRAYLGVNFNWPDLVARDLAAFDDHQDVFVGLKFLAGYHCIPWDAPVCAPAWRLADDRQLLVLAHSWGGSAYDGPQQARIIATRYPHLKLLLGHSLHGDWEAAVALAREFPNVYLELTAVLDDRGPLEMFCAAGLSKKLLFGTDLPWFDPHHGIGSVLAAEISDADRHNLLHRNAERLLAGVGVRLGRQP